MKKKSKPHLIGKCPHCQGTFDVPQDWLDRIAEASLAAVERAANRREEGDGRYTTVYHIGPTASTY